MTIDHKEIVINEKNENIQKAPGLIDWEWIKNKWLRIQGKLYKWMKKKDGKLGVLIDRKKRMLDEQHCSK